MTNNTQRGAEDGPAPTRPTRAPTTATATSSRSPRRATTRGHDLHAGRSSCSAATPTTRSPTSPASPRSKVSPIASPDNIAFDNAGNLWIATDGQPERPRVQRRHLRRAGRGRRARPRPHVRQRPVAARRRPARSSRPTTARSSSRSSTRARAAASRSRSAAGPTVYNPRGRPSSPSPDRRATPGSAPDPAPPAQRKPCRPLSARSGLRDATMSRINEPFSLPSASGRRVFIPSQYS